MVAGNAAPQMVAAAGVEVADEHATHRAAEWTS